MNVARKPTLLVVGLGMMGASLAAAAKRRQAAASVLGWARRRASVDEALKRDFIDDGGENLEALAERADIAILATPMSSVEVLLPRLRALADRGAILSDLISVKTPFVDLCRRAFGRLPPGLIPGHPIAGSERTGMEAANPDLFSDRWMILTPHRTCDPQALRRLREFWEELGAHVGEMDARKHDEVVAMISHLPHLAAFALMDCFEDEDPALRFAGTGLRDFSRIAEADADMWAEIATDNRTPLSQALQDYMTRLEKMRKLLDAQHDDSSKKLKEIFVRARRRRLGLKS